MVREDDRPCVRGCNRPSLITSLVLFQAMKYPLPIYLIRIIGVHPLRPQEQVERETVEKFPQISGQNIAPLYAGRKFKER